MKKIKVEENKCIGCGACVGITDGKIFDFNDDGYAYAKEENFDKLEEEIKEEVIDAKEGCPTEAITIEEETKEEA